MRHATNVCLAALLATVPGVGAPGVTAPEGNGVDLRTVAQLMKETVGNPKLHQSLISEKKKEQVDPSRREAGRLLHQEAKKKKSHRDEGPTLPLSKPNTPRVEQFTDPQNKKMKDLREPASSGIVSALSNWLKKLTAKSMGKTRHSGDVAPGGKEEATSSLSSYWAVSPGEVTEEVTEDEDVATLLSRPPPAANSPANSEAGQLLHQEAKAGRTKLTTFQV